MGALKSSVGGASVRKCLLHVNRNPANQPFHPGEILQEMYLQPSSENLTHFAQKLGWTRARLSEIINGRRGITAESAWDLATALKTSPELWMNLQASWDLARVRKQRAA